MRLSLNLSKLDDKDAFTRQTRFPLPVFVKKTTTPAFEEEQGQMKAF